MACGCNPDTGASCMLHFDMDEMVLLTAVFGDNTGDFSVNFISVKDGSEVTGHFSTEENARNFISLIGDSFVECNFTLEEK